MWVRGKSLYVDPHFVVINSVGIAFAKIVRDIMVSGFPHPFNGAN